MMQQQMMMQEQGMQNGQQPNGNIRGY